MQLFAVAVAYYHQQEYALYVAKTRLYFFQSILWKMMENPGKMKYSAEFSMETLDIVHGKCWTFLDLEFFQHGKHWKMLDILDFDFFFSAWKMLDILESDFYSAWPVWT